MSDTATPREPFHTALPRVAAPLRQTLLHHIRESISSGDLAPGQRLIERDLCEKYGVSRTLVREVLRHLAAEGFVTIAPNKSSVVNEFSQKSAADLFAIRAVLEGLAAAQFAERATDEDRRSLQESCDQVAGAYSESRPEERLRAKDEYYAALFRGSHNELLSATIRGIHARVRLLRSLSLQHEDRLEPSLSEIRNITSLATAGKSVNAAAAAKLHVERAAEAAFPHLGQTSITPPKSKS